MANNPSRIFRPMAALTTVIATSTTSAATALPGNATEYRFYNSGTVAIFIDFGTSGVVVTKTGTTAGMPVVPGAIEVYRPSLNATHVATLADSGTPSLYVTPGEGA